MDGILNFEVSKAVLVLLLLLALGFIFWSFARKKLTARDMAFASLFAGISAVGGQLALPLPFTPVPITFQQVGPALAGILLGSRLAALSQVVYIFLGAVGLPVFAGFRGGLDRLVGPTGGFLLGFVLAAYVIGKLAEKQKKLSYGRTLPILFLGMIVYFTVGMVQLAVVANLSLAKAFYMGVAPFFGFDAVKMLLVAAVGVAARRALAQSGRLPGGMD